MRYAMLILLCLLAPARALEAVHAAPDSTVRDARAAMAASLAFPGLGQLYTGGRLRTLSVYALETWCLSNILREGMEEDRYRRHAAGLGEEESWQGFSRDELEALADGHRERKKDFVWRLMPVMIYSLLDAYVSAHLYGFETEDLRPRAALLPAVDDAGGMGLQLRVSF